MMSTKNILFVFLFAALTAHAQIDSSFVVNIENEAVHKYLTEVHYTSAEDESQIEQYNVSPPSIRYIPNPAVVKLPEVSTDTLILVYSLNSEFTPSDTIGIMAGSKEVNVYNLVPSRLYYYKVESPTPSPSPVGIVASGTIEVQGQVRMIYTPSTFNVRDIGGWPTVDGQRIKYEKIYRGAELNGRFVADSIDIVTLKKLGIAAEIDMRAWYEEEHGVSAFGFLSASEVESGEVPSFYASSDSGQLLEHLNTYMYLYRWRMEFNFIVNNMRVGRPVYVHCRHGADRTGFLCMLMEGLLGVGYDGLMKDYLLTLFWGGTNTKEIADGIIDFINGLPGNTLQERFNYFFVRKVGASQADVDYFCSEMLEDIPISTSVNNFSIHRSSRIPGIYDLRGVKIDKESSSRNHGILIEVGSDGSVRKINMK